MIGRTNAGGGGLNIKDYAISVTFPVGSECTCTDGVKVLKSKGTLAGTWIFPVAVGDWTVTISRDGASVSQTVSITTDNKSVHLDMGYRVYLVRNGLVSAGLETVNITPGISYGWIPCIRTYNSNRNGKIFDVAVPVYAKTLYIDIKKGRRHAGGGSYIDIGGVRKSWAYDTTDIVEVAALPVESIAGSAATLTIALESSSNSPEENQYSYISDIWFD